MSYVLERTPLLIAAYNEEAYIGHTLDTLGAAAVEPLVLVNGSTDNTASVARAHGATVIERKEMGKLPALQAGVRYLRDQQVSPEQPLLFLDADSRPLLPVRWAAAMQADIPADERPFMRVGMLGYTGHFPVDLLRTARRIHELRQAARRGIFAAYGANMLVKFSTEAVREQFLDMPHIWPGEDRATAQLLSDNAGRYDQSTDPRTLVLASTRMNPSLWRRLRYGRQAAIAEYQAGYLARRAPSAIGAFADDERLIRPYDAAPTDVL